MGSGQLLEEGQSWFSVAKPLVSFPCSESLHTHDALVKLDGSQKNKTKQDVKVEAGLAGKGRVVDKLGEREDGRSNQNALYRFTKLSKNNVFKKERENHQTESKTCLLLKWGGGLVTRSTFLPCLRIHLRIYTSVCLSIYQMLHLCGGQKTTCGSPSSPSTILGLTDLVRWFGSAARTFTS